MSNLETRPEERVCSAGAPHDDGGRAAVEILEHRDVPLGGTRAMRVRRTIPQRARSLVGAWCFLDHYGPDPLPAIGDGTDGMQVPPHPHTGLQTVTWLFAGEILHRDAVGSLQTVRPGELNLMTAGRGISHSEESPRGERPPVLHGVQLWVALPGDRLADPPAFEHHADLPVATVDDARVQVFLGALRVGGAALRSPATTYTPIVGAQLDLAPGARVTLDVDPTFEHGLLVDEGAVRLEGSPVPPSSLGYVEPGRTTLVVEAGPDAPARVVLGASRSARTSSCGGTSWAARTTTSRAPARTGRPSSSSRGTRVRTAAAPGTPTARASAATARSSGTTADPCPRPRCPTSACARAPGPPRRRAGRPRQ